MFKIFRDNKNLKEENDRLLGNMTKLNSYINDLRDDNYKLTVEISRVKAELKEYVRMYDELKKKLVAPVIKTTNNSDGQHKITEVKYKPTRSYKPLIDKKGKEWYTITDYAYMLQDKGIKIGRNDLHKWFLKKKLVARGSADGYYKMTVDAYRTYYFREFKNKVYISPEGMANYELSIRKYVKKGDK